MSGAEGFPDVFPQGYPLWAVRACSADDEGESEVGLVVGWEQDQHSSTRTPLVASLGDRGRFDAGIARDWRCEIQSGIRGSRWVERVELYTTLKQAETRTPDLHREICAHHDALWPEDAPPTGVHTGVADTPETP